MEVQEAERRHLARELHDEIGQVLTGLKMTLEGMRERAELLGGHLVVESAPGAGTRVTAGFPIGRCTGRRRARR